MQPSNGAIAVAPAMMCFGRPAAAQTVTAEELMSKNPVRLGKSAVESLVSGSTTESVSRSGNTRKWENMAGGRLVGVSHGGLQRPSGTSAEGKWRVEDDGKYCVDIAWTGDTYSAEEKWCGTIVKAGDDYYTMFSKTAMKVSFKK